MEARLKAQPFTSGGARLLEAMAADKACALEVNEGGKFCDSNDRNRFKRRSHRPRQPAPCLRGADEAEPLPMAGRPHRYACAYDEQLVNEGQTRSQHLKQAVRGHAD